MLKSTRVLRLDSKTDLPQRLSEIVKHVGLAEKFLSEDRDNESRSH
jgi:hypothetical protein